MYFKKNILAVQVSSISNSIQYIYKFSVIHHLMHLKLSLKLLGNTNLNRLLLTKRLLRIRLVELILNIARKYSSSGKLLMLIKQNFLFRKYSFILSTFIVILAFLDQQRKQTFYVRVRFLSQFHKKEVIQEKQNTFTVII